MRSPTGEQTSGGLYKININTNLLSKEPLKASWLRWSIKGPYLKLNYDLIVCFLWITPKQKLRILRDSLYEEGELFSFSLAKITSQ
jgi:hypothetical protein